MPNAARATWSTVARPARQGLRHRSPDYAPLPSAVWCGRVQSVPRKGSRPGRRPAVGVLPPTSPPRPGLWVLAGSRVAPGARLDGSPDEIGRAGASCSRPLQAQGPHADGSRIIPGAGVSGDKDHAISRVNRDLQRDRHVVRPLRHRNRAAGCEAVLGFRGPSCTRGPRVADAVGRPGSLPPDHVFRRDHRTPPGTMDQRRRPDAVAVQAA